MIINLDMYLDSLGVHESIRENHLIHYGTPRHSGRYPWGSGDNEGGSRDNKSFLGYVSDLRKQGLSEKDIAVGMGMTTTELRTAKSIAKNEQTAADLAMLHRLKEKDILTEKLLSVWGCLVNRVFDNWRPKVSKTKRMF